MQNCHLVLEIDGGVGEADIVAVAVQDNWVVSESSDQQVEQIVARQCYWLGSHPTAPPPVPLSDNPPPPVWVILNLVSHALRVGQRNRWECDH